MVIERWFEMRFCQVLFAAIVLCFTGGCALPERGDPSLLYYRDNGSWFPEAMNDVLAEWTYDNASAATAEDFRHFLDLQGKTLRFTVQEWGTKSKKYDPHVLGSHSYFSIANVESRVKDIPEMETLKDVDVAFLPCNLPYTMTPEQLSRAAKMFNPRVLFPYHYGNTEIQQTVTLLKGSSIDVRIRNYQ